MDILAVIEELKKKLDVMIETNAPYDRILELSMKVDEMLVRYYRHTINIEN